MGGCCIQDEMEKKKKKKKKKIKVSFFFCFALPLSEILSSICCLQAWRVCQREL